MNRVAKDIDLSALTGKIVETVSLSRHQVIIRLEDDLFISIEGECLFDQGSPAVRSDDYVSLANNFARLLGARIEKWKVVSDDAVALTFSNGMHLTLFDSNERYESFQIQLRDKLIVV